MFSLVCGIWGRHISKRGYFYRYGREVREGDKKELQRV
jgi:hypothetical protein